MRRQRWTYGWAAACCLLAAWAVPARADTRTVGTNGATGVDHHSIQEAINYLDNIDPATDGDSNTYHTILIQAGTYNQGDEESWQTHTKVYWSYSGGDGRGFTNATESYPSKSLITINDNDEDLDDGGSTTNNYLDGLHVIGAGIDKTIIDGENAGVDRRILFIKNKDVVVQGMTLKRGRLTWGYKACWGAGILSISSGRLLLEDVKIEDCDVDTNGGGCVDLRGMDGVILRRVEMTGCDATGIDSLGNSLYVQCATGGKAFFDRLYLHDNTCRVSAVRMGSIHPQCVLFNSMIVRTAKWSDRGGMGLYVSDASGSCTSYVANCTIADNASKGAYLESYCGPVRLLNNIFSDNGAPPGGNTYDAHPMHFMHNVMDETGFAWGSHVIDGYSSGASDDGTNDPIPSDPKFLDQPGLDYRIPPDSPAMDRIPTDGAGNDAFVLTHTNGFVYVDMNKNGSYDQQLDVIVKLRGYAPGTNDWVSTMDLAGRPRLRAQGLDAGCYEWQPPGGTVVTFK